MARRKDPTRMATSRSLARRQRRGSAPGRGGVRKLSRLHRPDDMSLEAWQRALRRQFGREQKFLLKRTGDHPVFSEFEVTNPHARTAYRVAIRGVEPGNNFCSCPDFVTNTLGTCKHIEFTLARLERAPGGRKALAGRFEPPFSELYLHYGARREVRFRPRADAPAELTRLAARQFGADGALLSGAFAHFDGFLAKAARLDPDLRCYEDALGFVAQVRDAERRANVLAEAFPRGSRSAAFTGLLRVPLYDYQREAVLFAARAGRSVIGDDMGLGKTIEAIAAVEIMARHFGVERVLVVCPTSLKHQWEREILRVIDRPARVIRGFRRSREEAFRSESFYKITNYDTVYRDLDLITAWAPDLVILDEAQRIKNWNTRTARSVKRIASPYAIVLTGTPLENRLEELVSIVQFIDQHRLGPTFRFLFDHQILDEYGKVIGYRDLDRIGKTLAPILIRRRKEEVLPQLPERMEKPFLVPMTPQQMQHHEDNREIVGKIVTKWRRYLFLSEADQRRLMIALQNMRMACDSTYLLDQATDHGTKADEVVTLLDEMFEGTTEEGMLSVLGFKRSLFAGVLDGGEREVFLGGSRLKRFMESVEGVTAGIPASVVEEAPEAAAAEVATEDSSDGDGSSAPAIAGTRPAADPLGGLLRAGLELLTHVASAAGTARPTDTPVSSMFERIRDDSGQSYLRIRMPEPEVMDRVAGALEALLRSLKG